MGWQGGEDLEKYERWEAMIRIFHEKILHVNIKN